MAKRIRRDRKLSTEESQSLREARAEFSHKPSKAELLASQQYDGPMSIDEYLQWRQGAGDAPLI